MSAALPTELTVLDAHVHVHDCFDLEKFFTSAYENLRAASQSRAPDIDASSALLLTESYGVRAFDHLVAAAKSGRSVGAWSVRLNDEPESVCLTDQNGRVISVIAGRQIVTSERLEILALGTTEMPEDRQPIETVIEITRNAGALCVLPWGFGKWTGHRGQIVRKIIAQTDTTNFFIGDNAGRLRLWPEPGEFATARNRGIPILPGSDPLPYQREQCSAGRFGFTIEHRLNGSRPFEHLRQLLIGERVHPTPFGRLESLLPFVTNQVAMQLRRFS